MSENLIPLFTGHPSWYVSGGSSTFTDGANTRTISTKSDGSIRFQSTGQFFYLGSTIYMLRSTYPDGINYEPTDSAPTDLQLTSGYYHFGIEPANSNLSVSLVSVSDGGAAPLESVPSESGDDIVHALIDDYYYLRIYMRSTMVNADLTFKPYLYRVGSTGNDEQAPVITVQPQSITVLTGNTATFSVTASGSNLSYSWEVSTDNGTSWTSPGWTTSSISFTAALSQSGYRYRCVVTENGTSTTSNSATLTVTSSSGGNDNPTDPTNPGGNDNPTNPSNPSTPGTSTNTHTELSELFTGTQSYTFPEDYFSSGRIYWRVRSYDSDGNPGEWSESATFICYGVGRVQELQCDGKPFATISWVANGQVSYEIKIDDAIGYGPFYGTDSIFVLPEPLEDGHHIVSVKVQNNLGLESPWTTIEIDVLNVPLDNTSSAFVVSAGTDAKLWWSPVSIREQDEFLLYRDNKLIRRFESNVTSFDDRVVLGYHTYKVIQRLPSGYYNLYTHPEVFLTTDITKIGLLSGGPWLNLTLTEEQYPTNTFKQTRIVEKTRIMGSKYPVVEISDFEELSATYEVVWPYEKREAAYQFKKLLGKAVIVKSRGEQVVVGVLDGYELPVNSKTVGYTFTIEQMDFDDDLSIIVSPDDGFGFYTDLDKIAFGLMNKMDLEFVSTNPGTSNPQHYEQIAEAINELKRYIAVLQSEATING